MERTLEELSSHVLAMATIAYLLNMHDITNNTVEREGELKWTALPI